MRLTDRGRVVFGTLGWSVGVFVVWRFMWALFGGPS